ncbi:MAG: STAS/SEC14 domain-containing protein [Sandaracinaceae bacterium]
MLTITNRDGRLVEMRAAGTLERADYDRVVPQLEAAAESGDLRLLVQLEDFRGWTPRALVEDLRYDLKHHDDFSKVAIVGEKKLEEWGTQLSKPFFSGEMKFFEDLPKARAWIQA